MIIARYVHATVCDGTIMDCLYKAVSIEYGTVVYTESQITHHGYSHIQSGEALRMQCVRIDTRTQHLPRWLKRAARCEYDISEQLS